jgi:hypothetical protein
MNTVQSTEQIKPDRCGNTDRARAENLEVALLSILPEGKRENEMKQNLKLARATRRARSRWEDAYSAKVEAFCAIQFDQVAASKAAARARETFHLYDTLETRMNELIANDPGRLVAFLSANR